MLPDARSDSRSFTFNTAFAFVGAHNPFEHVMFCVASVEIVRVACAADTHSNRDVPTNDPRVRDKISLCR
jgi:hypothetical protein